MATHTHISSIHTHPVHHTHCTPTPADTTPTTHRHSTPQITHRHHKHMYHTHHIHLTPHTYTHHIHTTHIHRHHSHTKYTPHTHLHNTLHTPLTPSPTYLHQTHTTQIHTRSHSSPLAHRGLTQAMRAQKNASLARHILGCLSALHLHCLLICGPSFPAHPHTQPEVKVSTSPWEQQPVTPSQHPGRLPLEPSLSGPHPALHPTLHRLWS